MGAAAVESDAPTRVQGVLAEANLGEKTTLENEPVLATSVVVGLGIACPHFVPNFHEFNGGVVMRRQPLEFHSRHLDGLAPLGVNRRSEHKRT
jgi:hypothetical protein